MNFDFSYLDIAFKNGSVITVNEKDEIAEAVGVKGNKIVFVGSNADIEKLIDESNPDIYQAIADRYLDIGCSVMTPDNNRLELMGKQDVRLIVNRVDRDMLSAVRLTIDDVMDSAGLPLTGIVLEDPNVTLAAAFGKPLLQYARRSPAAKAYRKIANRIQGFHEPITLR